MNWNPILAGAWWAGMIALFIVVPVTATRYRGEHRPTRDRSPR